MTEDLKEMNKSCYTLFVDDMFEKYETLQEKYTGKELYSAFKLWWHESGRRLDEKPTDSKFGTMVKLWRYEEKGGKWYGIQIW